MREAFTLWRGLKICIWQVILKRLFGQKRFSCRLYFLKRLVSFFFTCLWFQVLTVWIKPAQFQEIVPNVYISEFVTIYKTKTVVSVSPWTLAPCLHLTSVGSGQPSWPPLAHSINTAPRVESAYQSRIHRSCGFDPWIRKIPWKRKWQPTLVFLPGKFHGQKSLAVYSPWDHKELDMTELSLTHAHTHTGAFMYPCFTIQAGKMRHSAQPH